MIHNLEYLVNLNASPKAVLLGSLVPPYCDNEKHQLRYELIFLFFVALFFFCFAIIVTVVMLVIELLIVV